MSSAEDAGPAPTGEAEDALSAQPEAQDQQGDRPSTSGAAAQEQQMPAQALQQQQHQQGADELGVSHLEGTQAALEQPESSGKDAGDSTHRSTATCSSGAELTSEGIQSLSAQTSSLALSSSRPASAAAGAHLRGSRPNSAAIAATIEGFENDFVGERESNHLLDDVPEDLHPAEEEVTTEQLVAEKQQELAALSEANDTLQQRARQVLDLRNKGRPAVTGGFSQLDGADTRYRAALKSWMELRQEKEDVATQYQTKVFDMKLALEGRIQRADEVANTLKHFKREVALAAAHSKTGKPISQKLLADIEAKEHALEEDVQRVRLKNIHLGNALKKLESTIRNKEQLAEGLHLIDFEQLKIENQSLNEKIEERNEELVKLRKKTTVTVQILTHMKAKLAFIECENQALREDLHQLEAALAGKRDELASLKATRDRLWQQQRQLKEGSVFVTNPMLLQDMQAQKERRDDLMAEIELLKQQHAAASSPTASTQGSREVSPMHTTAAPGRLKSPLRKSSSKAASVKLLVASSR